MKAWRFLVIPLVALLVAGCGDGGDTVTSNPPTGSTGVKGVWAGDSGTTTVGTWDQVDWQ